MSTEQEVITSALSRSSFARLAPQIVERLLDSATTLDAPAGGVLYQEDGDPRCLLVMTGLIRVYMRSAAGREVTVRYTRPGDILGIATVVGGPAPVDVQIISDARLLGFPIGVLRSLGQTEPAVAWLLATEVTQRLYDTLEALAGNTFGTVRQRVARHLLDLAAARGKTRTLIAPVTQQELADAVGSVRAVVARSLAELRDAGLVGSSSNGIVILDPEGLLDQAWRREV